MKTKVCIMMMLALCLMWCMGQTASAQVITAVNRLNPDGNSGDTVPAIVNGPSPGGLQEGSLAFVDRTPTSNPPGGHQLVNLPPEMIGFDYIMTCNDDKDNPNHILQVTLASTANLYVFVDNRVGDDNGGDPPTIPAGHWLWNLGFVDSGLTAEIDESGDGSIDQYWTIYVKEKTPPGMIELLEQNDGGSRNMYVVAANASGGKLAPSVDAGPDQVLVWPDDEVTLAATIQDDGDPNKVLKYWWEVTGQPAGSSIDLTNPAGLGPFTIAVKEGGDAEPNQPYAVTPTVTVSQSGIYELRLHARDEESDTNDTVRILVYPAGYEGMMLHYKLDDGWGQSNPQLITTAEDSAGTLEPNMTDYNFDVIFNDGVVMSGLGSDPNWITGPNYNNVVLLSSPADFLGALALFDDTDDYIAIDNMHYDNGGLAELTVAAWIRTFDGSDQVIASFDRNEYWRLEINGSGAGTGQVGWDVLTSTGQVDYGSSRRVDDNEWHHVAGVFDNGTMTIYIDGVPEPSVSGGSTFGSGDLRYGFVGVGSEANVFDGNKGPSNYFNGDIDDFRIYEKALTRQEILDVAQIDNLPPEADAGPDRRLIKETDGDSIALDATVTDIPGNYDATWTVLSGPGTITFSLPGGNDPEDQLATMDDPNAYGLYHLQLTATDTDNPAFPPSTDDMYLRYQEKALYDLLGHWKMDDPLEPASDSSGNDFDGILLGDPNLPTFDPSGMIGGALRFVNAGEDIDQAVDLSLVPGTDDITIMFWMKADSESKGKPIDKLPDGTGGSGFTIYKRDGAARRIQFRIGSDDERTNIDVAPAYEPGVWVHITCTFDSAATTGKVYINGLEQASNDSVAHTINNISTPLYFGMTSNTSDPTARFQGLLDHVRIYGRALSPLEVALQAVADQVMMEGCNLDIQGTQITSDLDKNCYVDVRDLKILLGNWLDCTDLSNPNCW